MSIDRRGCDPPFKASLWTLEESLLEADFALDEVLGWDIMVRVEYEGAGVCGTSLCLYRCWRGNWTTENVQSSVSYTIEHTQFVVVKGRQVTSLIWQAFVQAIEVVCNAAKRVGLSAGGAVAPCAGDGSAGVPNQIRSDKIR